MRTKKPKIYYAHCMAIYGTSQSRRDVSQLEKLGFEVVNPEDYQQEYDRWLLLDTTNNPMKFWVDLAMTCDAVAFRALPDGRIPAGIWKEVNAHIKANRTVIELPSRFIGRQMTVDETREYLRESGQR